MDRIGANIMKTTKNAHRVPQRQWRKWGDKAREVFNSLYYTLLHNQSVVTHPNQDPLPKSHWNTVAWNSAWLAADAVAKLK